MAYPIKYIENNLVFNHDGECFAYYELLPYNYSFLSPEQKYQVHDSFRQLIAQNRDGKIHALQISTESSIRAAQERSKQEVAQHIPLSEANAGDLVFFHSTYNAGTYITHVGLYVGNNRMYHAGNPIGYADLTGSYWQQHLAGAGRIKQ